MAPVLVDELVYEELEADHGHEAEPDHEADPHHDPQLQGGAHRLLAWEWSHVTILLLTTVITGWTKKG